MEQTLKAVSSETCEPPTSLIRQFLIAAAEIHQRDLTHEMFRAYESALSDLPAAELRQALNDTLRNERFWPTPAHVQQQWEARKSRQDKFDADSAWIAVHKRLAKWHYEPGIDGGPWMPVMNSRRPPADYRGRVEEYNGGFLVWPEPLDPAIESAVAQVGGWDRLRHLDDKAHDFVKRDFIAAHQPHSATAGYLGPSREEAETMLEKLPAELVEAALKL